MAISKVNPSAAASTSNTSYIDIPGVSIYRATLTSKVGTYSLALTVASKQAKIQFLDSNGAVITTASLDGTTPVTVNLATESTKIRAWQTWLQAQTSSVTASIEFKGGTLTTGSAYSGTVTTVSSTGSATINGAAYVILVGGGGGGANGSIGYGGGGGGSGTVVERYASNWSGSYTITIGAGGVGAAGQGANGDTINNTQAGSTIIANGGGTIFSAKGGTVANYGYNGNGAGGQPAGATGTYDFSGGVNGGGGNGGTGNAGGYGNNYRNATTIVVQGGFGDGGGTPTNYGNGIPGTRSGTITASGYGNGGGGSPNNSGAGDGSAGVAYIITNVQDA